MDGFVWDAAGACWFNRTEAYLKMVGHFGLLVISYLAHNWPALNDEHNKFMHWLSAGGIDIESMMLRISTFDGLRGLQATRDIKQGDVMLRIPNSMLLTYQTVLTSDLKDVFSPGKLMPQKDLLALFLLHEKGKGEKSKWAPYISMIPDEINSLLSFTDKDIDHVRTHE